MKTNNPTLCPLMAKASEGKLKNYQAEFILSLSKGRASFTTLLLIAFTSTAFGMELKQPNKYWIGCAADVILYGTNLSEFLSFISLEPIYPPESQFKLLPKEIQQTIVAFLSARSNSPSLNNAARAINSLAQVSKQLNELINEPVFCLQIIKNLAQQFNCSDEAAADALQTKEAKNRISIQTQFKRLFIAKKFNEKLFNQLYEKYKNYVDLNFTYHYLKTSVLDDKDTLLIYAIQCDSYDKKHKINSLLKTNVININYQNKNGVTALMLCAKQCNNPESLNSLTTSPNIMVNLQNKNGDTALHYACWRENNDKYDYIKILLNAGADPEITDQNGQTPLKIISKTGEEDDLDLIQEAIRKKHGTSQ